MDSDFTDLRAQIAASVGRALGSANDVAYLNFPDIANVGDPLLWLGARSILDDLDVSIVYQARPSDFDRAALAAHADLDMIILNGGGNFGDVWVGQHQIRQQVLDRFRDRPILQLPQTLWYEDTANLRRDAARISAAENVVLMWRERRSYELAKRVFDATNLLVPDTAFANRTIENDSNGSGITWLMRTDRESISEPANLPELRSPDSRWVAETDGPGSAIDVLRSALTDAHTDPFSNAETIDAIHRELATIRIRRGSDILASGAVTITDRLHGVILSAAMHIPVVALDNRSHKVHGVIDMTLSESSLVTKVTSTADARSLAHEILEKLQ